jgi:catechol 2,3-dioxygenase-like lactoylglutathione lyase family enzyme
MSKIRHVGIVVQDIEQAKRPWLEVLGFSIQSDAFEYGKEIDRLIGLENAKIRSLKMIDSHFSGTVELIEFFDPASIHNPLSEKVNHLGITHIALTVDNLERTVAELRKFAFRSVGAPTKSVNGHSIGLYMATNYNVLLELVEEVEI